MPLARKGRHSSAPVDSTSHDTSHRPASALAVTAAVVVLLLSLGPALPSAATGGRVAAPRASSSVMIMDYRYQPGSLTVTAGDSVTWTNHDQAAHDVAVTSGPEAFQSPMLSQGQSWSYTFGASGSYAYICSVHPDMTGSVAVEPVAAPPPAQVQPTPAPTGGAAVPGAQPTPAPGTAAPLPGSEASAAPIPGAAPPPVAGPAPATPTTAAPGSAASSSPSDELSAAPAGSSGPTTDLPPLAVTAVVVAIVLATTLALFGPGRQSEGPGASR